VPPGTLTRSRNDSGIADEAAKPNTSPTTTPSTAPKSDTIAASQRTIRRVWRRDIPTARKSPSSRVRSKTDSASVFAMPSTAITTASSSRTLTVTRTWSIWACWEARNSWRSSSSACGKASSAASTAERAAAGSVPSATLAMTTLSRSGR